ncbi:BTAD domain-containing putative transcriptional regulator [Nocardia wallacei]|uniref:BTAD domain-containing putative transcriptional regulator n=1 Tax=Nocardia wallacei TaxID=480035 RepID=UPI0024541B20|nr:BTAD domain-containing putative transcriptional regulator [Nocardia wallacei]
MTWAAAQSTGGSEHPLLIAVTGLGPRSGVTTTAVALAHAWPGTPPAVLVEADPAGGTLAAVAGTDPYLGLASLARAARSGTPRIRIAEHLQFLPGGPGFLAAPPTADASRAGWVTTLLTGPDHDRRLGDLAAWRGLGAAVFADCGAPEPGSALAPILAAADCCLVVVRTDLTDPTSAGHRIRDLTAGCRRRAVLLLGPGRDYASHLALPVLGHLPLHQRSAITLLHRTRPPHHRNRLLAPAAEIATTLHDHLRPTPPATPPTATDTGSGAEPALPPGRRRVRIPGRRESARPTVYRIELPTPPPAPDPARTDTDPTDTDPAETTATVATASRPAPPHTSTPAPAVSRDIPTDSAPRPVPPPNREPVEPAVRPGEPGLAIRVFGSTRVLWRPADPPPAGTPGVEITRLLQPRSRELLTVLVLHPDGLSRDELIDALWGQHPPDRPGTALTNALGRLRGAVAAATGHKTALRIEDRPRYRLDPTGLTVDFWEFTAAVARRRRSSAEPDHIAASRRILDIATVTATLAADLSAPWVEPLREAARRNTLNALGWLAAHTVTEDPRTTLGMLETAVETDPYNEPLWQDILRLHAKLGEYDALIRTYSLLSRKLAEIDATPSPETRQLLEHLRHNTR